MILFLVSILVKFKTLYVQCYRTNFSGDMDLEELLSTLIKTFVEFKNHEMIENTLIMKKLKRKLKKLSIRNSAVCNCHKVSHEE